MYIHVTSLADRRPSSQKLTGSEEEVIVQYILDLGSRGFPPQIADVAAMADQILAARDARPVGTRWAYRFVKRRIELKTRFSRAYDFQRALCEDPDALNAWFRLVANIKGKYGIQDCDTYNFDETGFIMGQICGHMVVTGSERRGKSKKVQPGNREWATAICCISGDGYDVPPYLLVKGVHHLANWYTEGGLPATWRIKTTPNGWTNNETGLDWIHHFDNHTKSRTKGAYRMLVLDGHNSHQSPEFEGYCKNHNIIPLCLPAHSSHLTQPLDVGMFSVLKRAYGQEINDFIRAHITNISKVEFFLAFAAAYKRSMTKENIAGGFRGAGLIPYNPETVISKLDIKLRTPSPKKPVFPNTDIWVSQTPHNPTEAVCQSTFVKSRINRHQSSSPTPIFDAVKQLAKGIEQIAHQNTLILAENRSLRKANEALSKRRRAKKSRVRVGGSSTVQEIQTLLQLENADGPILDNDGENGEGCCAQPATKRRCGNCGNTGHNARTCQEGEEMSDIYSSDCIQVN